MGRLSAGLAVPFCYVGRCSISRSLDMASTVYSVCPVVLVRHCTPTYQWMPCCCVLCCAREAVTISNILLTFKVQAPPIAFFFLSHIFVCLLVLIVSLQSTSQGQNGPSVHDCLGPFHGNAGYDSRVAHPLL